MTIAHPRMRAIVLAGLAGSSLVLATQASAALVTDWSYVTSSVFVPEAVTFNAGTGVTSVSATEISWGFETGDFTSPTGLPWENRSALTIGTGTVGDERLGGGVVTGTMATDLDGGLPLNPGEIGPGMSVSHWNNPILSAFSMLNTGQVLSTLTLTPLSPAGADYAPPPLTIDFRFLETPNDAQPCAGGTANPCGDLFGIFGFGNFNHVFNYAGIDYFLSTYVLGPSGQASPVGTLLDEECTALGFSIGCQGFRTSENAVTTAQFAFSIGAEPFASEVPEPGSIALLGIGLLGLGAVSARRIRKA